MIVIGTFKHAIELEYALSKLESIGIAKERLLVVCMDHAAKELQSDQQKKENSHSKGVEIGLACATALSVIGTSIGFMWTWGPIIWGLIAAFAGFGLGLGIHALTVKKHKDHTKHIGDVTVIVQCQANQGEDVQKLMWENRALAVGQAYASPE